MQTCTMYTDDLGGDLGRGSGKAAERSESEPWDAHYPPQNATTESCSGATPSQSYTVGPPSASDSAQFATGTTPVRTARAAALTVPPQPTSITAGVSRTRPLHRHCMHGRGPECTVCSGTAAAVNSVVGPRRARQQLWARPWSPDPDAQLGGSGGQRGDGDVPSPTPLPSPSLISGPALDSAPAPVPDSVPASANAATASGSASASAYPPDPKTEADLDMSQENEVLPEQNAPKKRRVGEENTCALDRQRHMCEAESKM